MAWSTGFAAFPMGASTAELIIGGLGAAASTAAVLTALWIALRADAVRARRHAPVLDLELVRGVMEVRLAVRNARDKTTARDVEVLVINVEHHPIHAVRQHPKMAPTSIEAVNQALPWNDGSTRTNIQPGLGREVPIATIIQDWDYERSPAARVPFADHARFLEMSAPVAERESFPVTHFPDEMKNAPARLRIAVIADNVNAAYYTIELRWEWENYVYSEAGRDAFDARLLDGHAAPTGNPHLLAGGPWGEAAARAASGSNDLPDGKD